MFKSIHLIVIQPQKKLKYSLAKKIIVALNKHTTQTSSHTSIKLVSPPPKLQLCNYFLKNLKTKFIGFHAFPNVI